MSHSDIRSAIRPQPDQPMVDIADYVIDGRIESEEAYDTARYMLLDSLACAMLAMKFPDCVKHLGPLVPGATLAGGAMVPGTNFELDPAQAAFNIAGWISTTPGSRPNGAIRRTTSARSSPWPITSAAGSCAMAVNR
jgi:hypothetical protein